MRKALLGTSALVAVSVLATGPAGAAEPLKIGLGGYMDQAIGFVSHDGDSTSQAGGVQGPGGPQGFDNFEDSEVHFKGSTTLDNGIKVAVHLELEGLSAATGDDIDEAYMTLTHPTMGQVVIGSENMPNYKMHYGAPSVSAQGFDESNYDYWAPNPSGNGGSGDSAYGNTSGRFFANDPMHTAYYTPRLAGFQLGVGYAPDSSEGNAFSATGPQSGLSVGLNYRGEFDGVGLNASFGVIHWFEDFDAGGANGREGTLTLYQGGLNVEFSGFAVGAAYATTANKATASNSNTGNSNEAWTLNLGASYETGPYGVSVGYQVSEGKGALTPALSGDDELSIIEVAGTYNLGPGITWHAALARKDEEGEAVAGPFGGGDDLESWIGVTGITVEF